MSDPHPDSPPGEDPHPDSPPKIEVAADSVPPLQARALTGATAIGPGVRRSPSDGLLRRFR